jgi:hypothetical protein
MKKVMMFTIPFKAFAAMIFAGIIILYMVSGVIYTVVSGEEFNYSIPFIFVLQGVGLSVMISLLWGLFFSNVIIKKWRFFIRHILFELSLLVLLTVCFFSFLAIPTDWAKLWLITLVILSLFLVILFGICELYYKKTGKHYTEILKAYKNELQENEKGL